MRTPFKALAVLFVLGLMAAQGISATKRARAQYDVQQILLGQSGVINPNQPVDSLLRVSYILELYGLDKNHEKEFCVAQDFLNLVNNGVDAAADRLEATAYAALQKLMADILTKYAYCKLADIDQICVFGNCFSNPLPECTIPTASDFGTFAKESAKQAARESYVARCVVDSSIKRLGDTVDKMLQQMGPDGGPAVATDWLDTLHKAP